ncbi:MAG: hypothetical protein RLZZ385_65 [Pseudomonadota bacterium]|jgi:AcrR family transcriptional regulator
MTTSNTPNRPLGRPPGVNSDQVRQQLLAAARELFMGYEFKAVSVRRIAAQAGVNAAMVNYYFGGKQGLYLAMVEQMLESVQESVGKLRPDDGHSLEDFIAAYMHFLADNPWWPNFIIREVLFGKEAFRLRIVARMSEALARAVLDTIGGAVRAGEFRSDLNPQLAALSLMGMMVFPFLSRPNAEQMLNVKLTGAMIDELAVHTGRLFRHGVAGKPQELP